MTLPAPERTYEPALLADINLSSLDWARTWVRTLLRDIPEVNAGGVPLGPGQPTRPSIPTWPEWSRTDVQIDAALKLDAVTDASSTPAVTYYRPHFTAARLYLGDPALWKSRAVDGSSESRRDSREIISAWLAQGAALDSLIPIFPLPPFETIETGAGEVTRQAPERPVTVVTTIGGGW